MSIPSTIRSSSGTMDSRTQEPPHALASPHASQASLASAASRASHHTHTSAFRETRMSSTTFKQLRSQYPADSKKSHVEFVLVASFNIHRGSVMEHQYPGFISSDEHMLAELMLPDQAHSRAQDWTIFFLHKDTANDNVDGDDDDETGEPRRRRGTRDSEMDDHTTSENDDEDEIEGPPLIYVLNLVSTKYDNTATRNAVCKAMAICTRHPFIHIYKPLLLLALDEYFANPVPETLAILYKAANAMDLSLLPRLSLLERNILQASNARDMFVEKFQYMLDARKTNSSRTSINSVAKSLSESPSTSSPSLRTLPRDTHEFESKVLYNNISVPIKVPTARFPEDVGDFSLIKLIQRFSVPHQTSPTPFVLHPHLTTGGQLTHPVLVLVNALLTQKRIMFLGHNMPSGEVAETVLAACTLASGGLLRGFTRHAFPYTDLTKIDDLLKVPGFIAGVTNPHFANKPEWWDLLCDLPTGRMTISNRIEQPRMTDNLSAWLMSSPSHSQQNAADNTGDAAFMDSVLRNINNRLGESTIRAMWRGWVLKFTRMSAVFEELVYGSSALYVGGSQVDVGAHGVRGHGYVWADDATRQRELMSNAQRIEGWRNTRSYYSLVQDLAHLYKSRPISSIDLHHHHDRLRTQKLTPDAVAAIYVAMDEVVRTDAEISQLLTVTPESEGGLFYISLGLLHPQKSVRYTIVRLLDRIRRHEAGKHFWNSLGRFSKMAFERIAGEMDRMARAEEEVRSTFSNGNGNSYEHGDEDLSRSTAVLEHITLGDG